MAPGGELFEAATASDVLGAIVEAFGRIVVPENEPPNCNFAVADPIQLWPYQKEVPIAIVGVKDPDGDALTITITSVTQDEPVVGSDPEDPAPDGGGLGTASAWVRRERFGVGNGRVYQISFVADDGNGGECSGSALVSVVHDKGGNTVAVDDRQVFDSTTEP